jgi:hypothetical protein
VTDVEDGTDGGGGVAHGEFSCWCARGIAYASCCVVVILYNNKKTPKVNEKTKKFKQFFFNVFEKI